MSMDGTNWTDVVANRNAAGSGAQSTTFAPVQAKYVKFTCLAAASMNDGTLPLGAKGWMSLADVKLYEDLAADPTPRANVRYDIWSKTNHDVTAELVDATRPVTVTNTEDGSTTHTFTENGEFTFEFEDAAGNVGTATATVDWIDKTPPSMSVEYSTTEPTSDDVVATLSFSEPVEITSDSGIATAEDDTQTMTFVENGSVDVEFQDEVGNTASATVEVSNIDKEAPTAQIEYSTTDITDGTVTATCVPDEDAEVTSNGGDTYVFDKNGTHVFEMIDAAGNMGTATAEVTWIKHMPVMHVEYSTTALTNGDVDAELVVESGDVRIMNNSGLSTYTFEQNGTFDFEYLDTDGMSGRITATVDNIDKEAPTATVTYDKENITNSNVIATITPSEEVTITSAGGNRHVFENNGSFEFTFMDTVGNEGHAIATVDWIDKTAPIATVSYDITEPTENEVTATITPNEDVTVTKPADGSLSHVFTTNGKYTFEFVDAAGNTGTAEAVVSWIKTPLPQVDIEYSTTLPTNGNVTATLVADENITVVNGDGSMSHTFTDNGEYTFEFVDDDGNHGTIVAEVSWIDRDAPTGTVEYSTTSPTNENVIAMLYIDNNEEVTILDSNTNAIDAMNKMRAAKASCTAESLPFGSPVRQHIAIMNTMLAEAKANAATTYTFTENGKHVFAFMDAAGNRGSADAEVTWIDKTADATVEYDTTELESGKKIVTATLVPQEDGIKVLNNNGSMEYVFGENGEFVFEIEDALGNKQSIVAKVDWLPKNDPSQGGDDGDNTNTNGNENTNENENGNDNENDNGNTNENGNVGDNTGDNTNIGDNANDNGNTGSSNVNGNENTGGNQNENSGGNSGNVNGNTEENTNTNSGNVNEPGNANVNENGNGNGNQGDNDNENGNVNGNVSDNDNKNSSSNGNDNKNEANGGNGSGSGIASNENGNDNAIDSSSDKLSETGNNDNAINGANTGDNKNDQQDGNENLGDEPSPANTDNADNSAMSGTGDIAIACLLITALAVMIVLIAVTRRNKR